METTTTADSAGPEESPSLGDPGSPEEFAAQDRQRLAALPRFFRVLDFSLKTVMVTLLVVLIVAVGVNVFGRFVLDKSLAVSDELARLLFVWVIFLGAGLAHLHREHIVVDTLIERLPERGRRALTVVQELLVLALMGALLLGARDVMSTSPGNTPLLNVPYNLYTAAVPVAAVMIGLITVYRIAVAVRPAAAHSAQED